MIAAMKVYVGLGEGQEDVRRDSLPLFAIDHLLEVEISR